MKGHDALVLLSGIEWHFNSGALVLIELYKEPGVWYEHTDGNQLRLEKATLQFKPAGTHRWHDVKAALFQARKK